MSIRDASPDIQEVPSTSQVDDMLEGPADVPSIRKELSELHEKVDDLLRMMRAVTAKQSKKRAYDEASSTNETPPAARVRIESGATDAPQYVARAKEPSIPLPDAFDGNPKNLKKFLTELDLCFRAAPTKFAGDDAKVITAGRLCTGTKVYPWWNTWLLRWKEKQVGYQTWKDFEYGIKSEFKDHLERKDARQKLKRTKQTGKVRDFISLMQSLNIDAGYDDEFLWEFTYEGLKPNLKRMWALHPFPPEGLRDKYATLIKLGAVLEDTEADLKDGNPLAEPSESKKDKGKEKEDEGKEKRKRKRKRGNSESTTKNEGDGKPKAEARVPPELWAKRRKAGLCMKCGKKHNVKDCKSPPVVTESKEELESPPKPKNKGKDSENVASVDRSEPEIIAAAATATHEAAAQVGRIYEADSDDEVLNWDLSDTD